MCRLVFRVFVLSLQGLACSAFSCLHQGFLKRSNPPPTLQSKSQPGFHFLGRQHRYAFGAVAENLKCDANSFKRDHRIGLFAKASNGDESDGFWDIGDITEKLDKTVRQQKQMKSQEMDTVLSRGLSFGLSLGEAIDKAVSQAATKIPPSSVPALAVILFSSEYSEQGYGRILPLLLRSFALYGGKPWRDGVTVIGCSVAGFEGHEGAEPGVSVTLLQSRDVKVVPFCVGDESARWSREEWAYRAGLKDVVDDEDVTMLLLGHPSTSRDTLQALQRAYPWAAKVGGFAGESRDMASVPADDDSDRRCVVYRKGSGVLDKRGQLLFGESKEAAKYSSSDDIFHDGGTWRRTGLVAVALQGLVIDSLVSIGALPTGPRLRVSGVTEDGAAITLLRGEDRVDSPAGALLQRLLSESECGPDPAAHGLGVPVGRRGHDGAEGGEETAAAEAEAYAVEGLAVGADGSVRLASRRVSVGDTVRLHARHGPASQAALQQVLSRLAAAKAVRREDGLLFAGGLAFVDSRAAEMSRQLGGTCSQLEKAVGTGEFALVGGAILHSVVASMPNLPLVESSCEDLGHGAGASLIITVYGGDKDAEDLDSLEALYSDTIVGAGGQILEIPKYQEPLPSAKRDKRNRRSKPRGP